MSTPTAKRLARKRKKSRNRRRHHSEFHSRRARVSQFPEFVFDYPSSTPCETANVMKTAVKRLVLNHSSLLDESTKIAMYTLRRAGCDYTLRLLSKQIVDPPPDADSTERMLMVRAELQRRLCDAIVANVKPEHRTECFPFSGFTVSLGEPSSSQVLLRIRSLRTVTLENRIAKTLLIPGMEGTPEHGAYWQQQITSWDMHRRVRRQMGEIRLLFGDSYLDEMLESFTDVGYPQYMVRPAALTRPLNAWPAMVPPFTIGGARSSES